MELEPSFSTLQPRSGGVPPGWSALTEASSSSTRDRHAKANGAGGVFGKVSTASHTHTRLTHASFKDIPGLENSWEGAVVPLGDLEGLC